MGGSAGPNTVTASVAGLAQTATLTATARLPRWTVLVYLAADNTLAEDGIDDIDEIEAAGVDPEVQVVIQAEFSPTVLARSGCNSGCFNRPNFNTFRYTVAAGAEVSGPNGPTVDIGNRDMTQPAELRQFVEYARQVAPAERTMLVLWNHGNGYGGLIEDLTSGGQRLMSLKDVTAGLTGLPQIDIVDFDMCLMAGYETLTSLRGIARTVVFSQATEPGSGNPYTQMLRMLQQSSAEPTPAVAGKFVEVFDASYAGSRPSTTLSAYDMNGLPAFETALNDLASALTSAVLSQPAAIGAGARGAQRFEVAQLADIVDLVDSLRPRFTDGAMQQRLSAVRTAALNPSFRIQNKVRTGADRQAIKVDRASGLHILMPSGSVTDALPSSGPLSFSSYRDLYPSLGWTTFLTTWMASATSRNYVDLGAKPLELYAIWDSELIKRQGDVDLLVLEPDGTLYAPALGSVTPNGHLTPDSFDNGSNYEGFLSNRYVEKGTYLFITWLYADPQNYRPRYNIAYREGLSGEYTLLYNPNQAPQLALLRSWLLDREFSVQRLIDGMYTDLQIAATWTTGAPAGAEFAAAQSSAGVAAAMRTGGAGPARDAIREPTPAQIDVVRDLTMRLRHLRSQNPHLPNAELKRMLRAELFR
jgi:hypothetical protein